MPVGKPTPNGDIVMGGRHYRGQTLGSTSVWNCPACGTKNEGRAPEQGCAHCGAGDPAKSIAGKPQSVGDKGLAFDETGRVRVVHHPEAAHPDDRFHGGHPAVNYPPSPTRGTQAAPIRVLRLIEYLIKPGETADLILRRSLVGRLEMSWGTLTGTIVDSCDARQEDLLSLAHRQPGVWMANQDAVEAQPPRSSLGELLRRIPPYKQAVITVRDPVFNPFADAAKEREDRMEMPDTGPAFNSGDAILAKTLLQIGGLKFVHTLALALSQIAPELEANMEPEKFLSAEACLRLANALMAQIPQDWEGDVPPPAPDGATHAD